MTMDRAASASKSSATTADTSFLPVPRGDCVATVPPRCLPTLLGPICVFDKIQKQDELSNEEDASTQRQGSRRSEASTPSPRPEEVPSEDEPVITVDFCPDDEERTAPRISLSKLSCTSSLPDMVRCVSSIRSSDMDLKAEAFAEKAVLDSGGGLDLGGRGICAACRRGKKYTKTPNQDSWCVYDCGRVLIYGVFDGHGPDGQDVSGRVAARLPALIAAGEDLFEGGDATKVLQDAFEAMQEELRQASQANEIDASDSGTTATVVVHDPSAKQLYVAHVGDSGCMVAARRPETACLPKPLRQFTGLAGLDPRMVTKDHRPEMAEERKRIEAAGGCVKYESSAGFRIYAGPDKKYPGLNMSRSLGDLVAEAEAGISCRPSVSRIDLSERDVLILLCSDGVWEFLQPAEVANCLAPFSALEVGKATEKLAQKAWDKWMAEEQGQYADDITALLIHLEPRPEVLEPASPLSPTSPLSPLGRFKASLSTKFGSKSPMGPSSSACNGYGTDVQSRERPSEDIPDVSRRVGRAMSVVPKK
eukprot:TRINITY_DN39425_c0_g1_i1.p1 TRINITY_DN39425_c0_g1~~TRINITY_DN39425_c0_g1_i1.p1  ORF type:complete len:548 (-),score=112.23 TRINITY_DN39425_c0_g1_i1:155-1756(-)